MSQIKVTVNGHDYPALEQDFVNKSIDSSTDVTTLDSSLYTDFNNNTFNQWSMRWDSLTQEEYDVIRADYDAQFTDYQYPLISIPFYSVSDVPARMYINDKNIWNNCGSIQGVEVIFRETAQLPVVS
jgi:hypothetical protein